MATRADSAVLANRPSRSLLAELFVRVYRRSPYRTAAAPHVRAAASSEKLLMLFVLSSAPALVVGLWNLGWQISADGVDPLAGWQGAVAGALGLQTPQPSVWQSLLLGAVFFLPALLLVLAISAFWEAVFATVRRRPMDPGWLPAAWLYVLLLPPTIPLELAALGMTFGIVFGFHLFGGTGRYLVNPALLGIVFLTVAYPDALAIDRWVPGASSATSWAAIAASGGADSGLPDRLWLDVVLGREIGSFGAPSALACGLGAAFLIFAGAASWRTVVGAFAGVWMASTLLSSVAAEGALATLPWHFHLVLGSFAFGIAFIATDPTTAPLTRSGRFIHGALIGLLTVSIRVLNPEHPEGTLFALLLASLFVPLLDYVAVHSHIRRRRAAARSAYAPR